MTKVAETATRARVNKVDGNGGKGDIFAKKKSRYGWIWIWQNGWSGVGLNILPREGLEALVSIREPPVAVRGPPVPSRGPPIPAAWPLPGRGSPVPARGPPLPARGPPVPARGLLCRPKGLLYQHESLLSGQSAFGAV